MPIGAVVRARVDEKLKDNATAMLSEMGLTVSDFIRIALTRVVNDKALPFDMKVPNVETRAAMDESRALMKARSARFNTATDMVDALGRDIGVR